MTASILVSDTSSPFCTENYGQIDSDDVTTVQVTWFVMMSLRAPHFSSYNALFLKMALSAAAKLTTKLNNLQVCYYDVKGFS